MSNWCTNELTVDGPEEDIARFKEDVSSEDSDIDFNLIIPIPIDLKIEASYLPINEADDTPDQKILRQKNKANLKKYGYKDWYDFCIHEWGTKWAVSDFHITDGGIPTHEAYGFQSAWAPPTGIVVKLGEMFPTLTFELKYYELGSCFAGRSTVHGKEVDEVCFSDQNRTWGNSFCCDFLYEMCGEDWYEENKVWFMKPDTVTTQSFHISNCDKDRALEALKSLTVDDLYGDYVCKSYNYMIAKNSLEEAMYELDWELTVRAENEDMVQVDIHNLPDDAFDFNPNCCGSGLGDIIGVKPCCHATSLDDRIFMALAPFIKAGSFIGIRAIDGDEYSYDFDGQTVIKNDP